MSYKVYPTNNPDAMTLTVEEESGGGSGESSVMFVTLTQDTDNLSYTVNKTYAEMVAAHQAGKLLVLVMDDDGDSILHLKQVSEDVISFMNFAVTMYPYPAYLECTRVIISSEDEVTVQVGTLVGES